MMRLFLRTIFLLFILISWTAQSFASSEGISYHANIYSGYIGSDLKIYMILSFERDQIKGSYYYEKYKEDLGLLGHQKPDGSFAISEFTHHSTGLLYGKFLPNGRAEGEWTNLDASRRLPFQLQPIADPTAYFVEHHISRYESILRNQGVLYDDDVSVLFRLMADFDNDGLEDCAFWDSGGWSVHQTQEYTVFFRNEANTGYSKTTLILFNPDLDYILPIRQGMARVIRFWHNPPINGSIAEEFITGEYTKKGVSYDLTYPQGKMKIKDPRGQAWLKTSGRSKALPVKIEWCMLSDYLNNSTCEWTAL